MNYKEYGITRQERLQLQRDIGDLREYILALKERDLGVLKCESCGVENVPYDIHHTQYGKDVTYYDLILLCWPCHKKTIRFDRT